jgi:hypothetical protein
MYNTVTIRGGYGLYNLREVHRDVIDDVISGLVRTTQPLRDPFSLLDGVAGKNVPKPYFAMLF